MKGNVFGLAEFVMYKEGEDACEWELVEGSAGQLCSGEMFLKGSRRDDDRPNFRTMIAQNGKVALMSRSGNTKNAIAKRCIAMSISRHKSNATRLCRGEELVVMEMGGIVGG
jgi:hypothetical protein